MYICIYYICIYVYAVYAHQVPLRPIRLHGLVLDGVVRPASQRRGRRRRRRHRAGGPTEPSSRRPHPSATASAAAGPTRLTSARDLCPHRPTTYARPGTGACRQVRKMVNDNTFDVRSFGLMILLNEARPCSNGRPHPWLAAVNGWPSLR